MSKLIMKAEEANQNANAAADRLGDAQTEDMMAEIIHKIALRSNMGHYHIKITFAHYPCARPRDIILMLTDAGYYVDIGGDGDIAYLLITWGDNDDV